MGADVEWFRVRAAGGRTLEGYVGGDANGLALVLHGGTPSAATPYGRAIQVAAARNLRLVECSRPGYAGSGPRCGRRVADVAADIAAVLDAIDADTFVTLGFSGGGPHALACAALLPERCAAAATVGCPSPYAAAGGDWLAGMAPENAHEFMLAMQGEEALSPYLLEQAHALARIDGDRLAAAFGALLSDGDRAALTGTFAEWLAESVRRSVSSGVAGWRDDDLAFVQAWGFDVASISRPVAVWQGDEDRMVPAAHGDWLAQRIPGARAHADSTQGHLSLLASKLDDVLDELVALAA